jgi:hypothetical protein
MSLKEKIRVVMNQKGSFVCPSSTGKDAPKVVSSPAAPKEGLNNPPNLRDFAA